MRDENSKKSKVNTWVVLSLFPFCSHFLEIVIFVFSKEFLFFAFLQVFILLDILFWLLKLSWSKKLVRKWFNIKGKTEEFQSDEVVYGGRYLMSSGFWAWKKKRNFVLVNWGFLEIMSTRISVRGSGKVCLYFTLLGSHLWDFSGYVVVVWAVGGESFIVFSFLCLLFHFGGGWVDGRSHILCLMSLLTGECFCIMIRITRVLVKFLEDTEIL